jgi:hypothetical protein
VNFHPHGDGIGVAWVAAGADVDATCRGLAFDVALFDQRGCASPRIVALHEGVSVGSFLDALGSEFSQIARRLPFGRLSEDESAAVAHFRGLALAVADRVVEAGDSMLVQQRDPEHVLMPPIGRHLVLVTGPSALERLVASSAVVTTVAVAGDADERRRLAALFPRARVCEPGQMQRPRFDGPLDLRGSASPAPRSRSAQ